MPGGLPTNAAVAARGKDERPRRRPAMAPRRSLRSRFFAARLQSHRDGSAVPKPHRQLKRDVRLNNAEPVAMLPLAEKARAIRGLTESCSVARIASSLSR